MFLTRLRLVALIAGLLLVAHVGRATADYIIYDVTVNTASISGTSGSVEVQLDPSNTGSDILQATISNFSSAANFGTGYVSSGDVSGITLASTLTLDDGTGFNDFVQDFTYGSSMSFKLKLSGNLSNPNPGAEFSLFLWDSSSSSTSGNTLLSSSDLSGAALLLTINPNGRTNSSYVNIQQEQPGSVAAPVPASITLLGTGAVAFSVAGWRQRRLRRRARQPL